MAKRKFGKREATRIALDNAAALIETMDLESLFADAFADASDNPDDELADWAQREAVRRIRGLIRERRT